MKIPHWKLEGNKMNISIHNNRNQPNTAIFCLTVLAVLMFAASAHAVVQSSTNFTMNSNVLDSGGGSASSANFQLNGTIGQSSPVGPASSTNFNVLSGYFPGILFNAVKFNNDVVMNLPSGVTILFNDNSSSNVLHPDTATTIGVADVDNNGEDDVIASFASGSGPGGTGGTFISRNQGALVLLDSKIANQIAVGDLDGNGQDDLLLDFGPDGLWLALDDTPPFLFLNLPVAAMASGDLDNSGQDDLVLSFTGIGTFNLNNFTDFIVLDGSAAEAMEVADVDNNGEDDVIVSFPAGTGPAGTGGTYISKNQGALVLLDSKTAEQIAVGDLDANGQDDLLLDFGADGFWLGLDDTPPFLFLDLPLASMASGDMDSNGQDDMILGLDAIATIVLKNFAIFDVLDPGVAADLATGDVDGN